jgi:magnesium transporter
MRLLLIEPVTKRVQDMGTWPSADAAPLPAPSPGSFYWLSCERTELEAQLPQLQTALTQLCGTPLVDLHVSDLLNAHIPSTFDYTSDYDVLVFRRLDIAADASAKRNLQSVETAPVGYAVFDALLLSVHPAQCATRTQSLERLLAPSSSSAPEKRTIGSRWPASSADLMLRQVNQMVDGYLNLRRDMAKQIDVWQMQLLNPKSRFNDWGKVLQARLGLHQLDEICEDQRSAIQDWIDALQSWQDEHSSKAEHRALELLRVRSRDVLEHIERVIHHVHRMEQSAEAAVQMHFSAQSNRANDIMRTLTTLTAIFLPLNLIAAVFGMNFDVLPLVHKEDGFWWAMAAMAAIGIVLLVFFWRRRYIEKASLLGEDS